MLLSSPLLFTLLCSSLSTSIALVPHSIERYNATHLTLDQALRARGNIDRREACENSKVHVIKLKRERCRCKLYEEKNRQVHARKGERVTNALGERIARTSIH